MFFSFRNLNNLLSSYIIKIFINNITNIKKLNQFKIYRQPVVNIYMKSAKSTMISSKHKIKLR